MRRLCVLSLVVLGSFSGWAALAWACTPQASIHVNPTDGRAGDSVAVTGEGFTANTAVQFRWDSSSGPLLATANTAKDGTVALNVTVPDAGPGVYYLQATAHTPDGYTATPSRAFRLLAPAAPEPANTGSAPMINNAVSAPTAAPSTKPTAKAPTHAPAHGRTSPVRHTQPAPSKRTTASHSGGSLRRQDAATGSAVGSGTRARTSAPTSPSVDGGSSGQAVFTDSLPPASHGAATPAKPGANGWPAFNPQHVPSLIGPAAVHAGGSSAVNGFGQRAYPTRRATGSEPGPQLAIGAAVLGLGLVLLFGGFAVAEVRRRRVPGALRDVTMGDGEAHLEPDRLTT